MKRLLGPLLFAALLFVYYDATVRQAGDSHYTLLASQALLSRQTLALEDAFRFPLDQERYPGLGAGELPYQVERAGGHLLQAFPPGTAVLSTPLVALLRLTGSSATAPDGAYDLRGELRMERRIAAFLAALYALLTYATARRLLDVKRSLLVAFAVAFGTQVWSTASRALWSHDWLLLLVGGALWLLLRDGPVVPTFLGAGLLLGAAFTVRPTAALSLAVVFVLALLRRDRWIAVSALTAGAAVPIALLCVWCQAYYHAPLPPYYRGRLGAPSGEALAGTLLSPSRGFLVFTPVVLWLLWIVLRHRRRLARPELALGALAAVALSWLTVSSFPHWWGGKCYGPRLLTDALPWLVLLAVLALRAWDAGEHRTERWAGAVLLALSVLLHTPGARSRAANPWNDRPLDVDQHPERVWDWRDPQFLAWLR